MAASQPSASPTKDVAMQSPTSTSAPVPPISSPTATAHPSSASAVTLDSPLRTQPIHPSLPNIKVPESALTTTPNTNPITLQPFTDAELVKYGFEKVRAQVLSGASKEIPDADEGGPGEKKKAEAENDKRKDEAVGKSAVGGLTEQEKAYVQKLQMETAALLKQKIDERDAKTREIEREMEEKEKIREVERKVFRKKLGAKEGP